MAKMKRVLALVLCAVMLLGVMPISGFADGTGAGKVIVYKVYNGDVANAQLVKEIDCNIGDNLYAIADQSGVSELAGYTMDKWFRMDTPGTKYSETGTVGGTHKTYVNYVGNAYTVTFDANGGKFAEGAESERTVTYGKEYGAFPAVTRTGYTLKGWTLNNEFKQSTDKVYTVGNQKLVAEWGAVQVKVKFDLDGDKVADSEMNPITVTYGQPYGDQLIDPPAQKGKEFKGWTLWEGTPVEGTTPVTKDTDHTLIATWNDLATISFDLNDGTAANEDELADRIVKVGDKFGTLPAAPTRTGYEFGYWALNSEDGEEIKADSVVTADAKLVAHWIPNTWKVYFDTKSDETIAPMTVTYGEAYGKLPVLADTEFQSFLGWKNRDGKDVDDDTIVTKNCNHTLDAQWGDKQVTVTFDVGDGEEIAPVKIDLKDGVFSGLPTTATRTGYQFVKWTYGGVNIVNGSKLPEDVDNIVLKAVWDANGFFITLNAGEGKFANNATTKRVAVTFGEAYPAMETPVSNDSTMKFDHWELSGKKVTSGVTKVATDGNHTLTAVYANVTAGTKPEESKPVETGKTATVKLKMSVGGVLENGYSKKMTAKVGEYFTLPNATKFGKVLDYWTDGATKYYAGEKMLITSEKTVYLTAKWKKAAADTTTPTESTKPTTPGSSTEATTPTETTKPTEPKTYVTEIIWAFTDDNGVINANEDGSRKTFTIPCEEADVGKKTLLYVTDIAKYVGSDGEIPEGYTLADDQEKYVEITQGKENAVTFKLKVNTAYTIVKWSIVKSDDTVVDSGEETLPTGSENSGKAMDYTVKAEWIPEGYHISGKSTVSVKQGRINTVTFKIAPNDYQTIVNWSIQTEKGEELASGYVVGELVTKDKVGEKGEFYLDQARIPADYELASTQPAYAKIKLGKENDVVFKVSLKPKATPVHYSFVDVDGNAVAEPGLVTLPKTTKIGEKSTFTCEEAGGLPTYRDAKGNTRTYRLVDATDRSKEIILGEENFVEFVVCEWPETGSTLFDRFLYWFSYTFLFKA